MDAILGTIVLVQQQTRWNDDQIRTLTEQQENIMKQQAEIERCWQQQRDRLIQQRDEMSRLEQRQDDNAGNLSRLEHALFSSNGMKGQVHDEATRAKAT